jgi:hypothetical protein
MRTHWLIFGLVNIIACSSSTGPGITSDVPPIDASQDDVVADQVSTDVVADQRSTDVAGDRVSTDVVADRVSSDVVGDRVPMGTCPVPPTPMGASRAGAMCTDSAMCGGGSLECDTDVGGGYCFGECVDNASQPCEQAQCGGTGSTCVSVGDGADSAAFCTPICNPIARTGTPGSCRSGTVCTGWWYTHETGEPDRTGCDYFCASDANCGAGMSCNVRTGACGSVVVATRRADGEPCNPTVTSGDPPENIQCRGICFQYTNRANQGICGSLINMNVQMACPDDPTHILPDAPSDVNGRTDNLGLCLAKECTTNADCTAPLTCISSGMGKTSYCEYAMAP